MNALVSDIRPGRHHQLHSLSPMFAVTKRAGHSTDVVATFDLSRIDGFVAIGGDGSLNEVLQGIMKRHDWQDALKIPTGIIPGGTPFSSLCIFTNFTVVAQARVMDSPKRCAKQPGSRWTLSVLLSSLQKVSNALRSFTPIPRSLNFARCRVDTAVRSFIGDCERKALLHVLGGK